MIKAILLDVDDTLLDFNKNATKALKNTFLDSGINYKEGYFDVFLKINNGLWKKIESGEITREEHKRTRFKLILDALGLSADSSKMENTFRAQLFFFAEKVDGAQEMLDYLKGKYRLFVASNAMHEQQIARLKRSRIIGYFEDIFNSEKIGFAKPTEKFFDYCFSKMGNVKKEEVAIVGDSLTADIAGGKAYGLRTVWFNKYKKQVENIQDIVDVEITSLYQIKDVF